MAENKNEINWRCINCGQVVVSKDRPDNCPQCGENGNFEHGEPDAEEDSILQDEGLD